MSNNNSHQTFTKLHLSSLFLLSALGFCSWQAVTGIRTEIQVIRLDVYAAGLLPCAGKAADIAGIRRSHSDKLILSQE